MTEACARAGGRYPCPIERLADLRANDHTLRPAALRVGAHPDGHISIPASVLLRLLDEKHQLGRSLSYVEQEMFDLKQAITTLRADRESWRKSSLEMEQRARHAETRIAEVKGILAWALDELAPDAKASRPDSICDVANRRRKDKKGHRKREPAPEAIATALTLLLKRLEEDRATDHP